MINTLSLVQLKKESELRKLRKAGSKTILRENLQRYLDVHNDVLNDEPSNEIIRKTEMLIELSTTGGDYAELNCDLKLLYKRHDCKDNVPILVAASSGQLELLSIFFTLDNYESINYTDIDYNNELEKPTLQTCLHLAVSQGHTNVVKYLLDHSASVDLKDKIGETALHKAARFGSIECLELLLNAQADPLLQNHELENPLHVAIENGHLEMVKYMKQKDFDMNCVGGRSRFPRYMSNSPLHIAVENFHYNIVEYLISECSANVNAKNTYGETPLHSACKPLITTTGKGSKDEYLRMDWDSNYSDFASGKHEYNIQSGKVPHGTQREINQILAYNTFLSDQILAYNIAKYLLDHGADPNVENFYKYFPYNFCTSEIAQQKFSGHDRWVAGSLKNMYLFYGPYYEREITPIHYACEINNPHIVLLLLDRGTMMMMIFIYFICKCSLLLIIN